MNDKIVEPLDHFRACIRRPSDAIRWACLLEATAPKAGNVYPGRPFQNLTYVDFVAAAEIVAEHVGQSKRRMSERMFYTVEETMSRAKTNVNLGIVLLIGPLVAADEVMSLREVENRNKEAWLSAIAEVLGEFDGVDGQNIYRAIDTAAASGLGQVDSMDIHDCTGEVDIIGAMKLAVGRDRVARQYATGYTDLIDHVVPVLQESISQCGDVLGGISRAHLRLLMQEPDTLIARKNGIEVATEVLERAKEVDVDDPASIARFDESLRGEGNGLNPGTTADLIAAALYMLLRTPTT